MGKRIIYLVLVSVLGSCSTSSKTVVPTAESRALDKMVEARAFTIESDWAQPMLTNSMSSIANSGLLPPGSNAGQISLIGNNNYFKMEGDTVAAYLPYYGERHAGGGYNANTAIEFKGIPKDLKIIKNDKSQSYQMSFDIREDTETYNVTVVLLPNLRSRIKVSSTQRLFISYEGRVSKLAEKEVF